MTREGGLPIGSEAWCGDALQRYRDSGQIRDYSGMEYGREGLL